MLSVSNRKEEIKILEDVFKKSKAQFLAVYGRRRIGKTFLIKNFFSNKGVYLEVTGLKDQDMHQQLKVFATAFSKFFF